MTDVAMMDWADPALEPVVDAEQIEVERLRLIDPMPLRKMVETFRDGTQESRDVGEKGKDTHYGWGLLDPHKMLAFDVKPAGVTIFIPGARIL